MQLHPDQTATVRVLLIVWRCLLLLTARHGPWVGSLRSYAPGSAVMGLSQRPLMTTCRGQSCSGWHALLEPLQLPLEAKVERSLTCSS
jgi:hypothetical protein